MVEMAVGDDDDRLAGAHLGQDEVAQRGDAQAGVDEQVGRRAVDMPDVRPQERVDVRFDDERDVLADHVCLEPSVGDGKARRVVRRPGHRGPCRLSAGRCRAS